MDQNIKGIVSSFKGTNKIQSSFEKLQGKKALNQFKPKNRKAEMVSKQNPISPKSQQFSIKQIPTQAKHTKDPQKVSIKNSQKISKQSKISQVPNDYLNAHLNCNCKQALKLQKGNRKLKQVSGKKEELLSVSSKQKKHISKESTSPNKNGVQSNENRNRFNTEYTQEVILQDKRIGRPKRTFSSSSQGKNSMYGIIAEYRRKNLRDSDSFDLKCSLENSITSANSQRAKNPNCQFQELNELLKSKSQNVLKYPGVQCEKQMATNRQRIGDSCSSNQSIRSMTQSLSMSKNLIEEKFRLMKQHLKYRKGRFCYKTGNICKKQFSSDKQQTTDKVLDESESLLLKQFEDEYKKTDADSMQNELRRYKELYRNSLQKVQNISKQLEIQKKKNELTKQIYKTQIQKLQRLNQLTQSNKASPVQQIPEGSLPQSNVQLDGNRIQDLKQKLRTNHIFSYQKYNQLTSGNHALKTNNQDQSGSDERPSSRVENQHNTSTDMIVELSEEMKSSGFFNSTLARSQIFIDNIQNECFKQKPNRIDSIKEDYMGSDFLFSPQIPAEMTFKKSTNALEEKLLTQKQEQSLLLDISSNLNNTKSSNNDYVSQSQARLMDSEQTSNGFRQLNKEEKGKDGKRVQIGRKFAQDCHLKINESQSESTSNSTYMKSKYQNVKHQAYLYD